MNGRPATHADGLLQQLLLLSLWCLICKEDERLCTLAPPTIFIRLSPHRRWPLFVQRAEVANGGRRRRRCRHVATQFVGHVAQEPLQTIGDRRFCKHTGYFTSNIGSINPPLGIIEMRRPCNELGASDGGSS